MTFFLRKLIDLLPHRKTSLSIVPFLLLTNLITSTTSYSGDCKSWADFTEKKAVCRVTLNGKSFNFISSEKLCSRYCELSEEEKHKEFVLNQLTILPEVCLTKPFHPVDLDVISRLQAPAEELLRRHEIEGRTLVNQSKILALMSKNLREITKQRLESLNESSKKDKIRRAFNFFYRNDPIYGKTPLERISVIFAASAFLPGQTRIKIEDYLHKLTERLFDQQVSNPEYFVSHGVDHSLNVVDYLRDLSKQNPKIIAAVKLKYGVDEREAHLILAVIGLSHDLGYPGVGTGEKPLHGPIGSDYVKEGQTGFLELIRSNTAKKLLISSDMVTAVHDHSADKVDEGFPMRLLTTDHQVVLAHLEDLPEILHSRHLHIQSVETFISPDPIASPEPQGLEVEDIEKIKKILKPNSTITYKTVHTPFLGRKAVLHQGNAHPHVDPHFGLEFHSVDLLINPLEGTVRLTDNMDVMPSRMTPLQRHPAFRKIYHLLGNGPDTPALNKLGELEKDQSDENWRDKFITAFPKSIPKNQIEKFSGPGDAKKFLVLRVIDRILGSTEYSSLSASEKTEIRTGTEKLGPMDIFHFGGTESIKNIALKMNAEGRPEVVVVVNEDQFKALNKIKTTEKNNKGVKESVGVGAYQIWRAREALQTLSYDGTALSLRILSEEGKSLQIDETE